MGLDTNINKIIKYVYKLRTNINNPTNLSKYFNHLSYHVKYRINNHMHGGNKEIEEIFEELNQLKQIIDSESQFKKTNMEERKKLITDYVKKYSEFKNLNPTLHPNTGTSDIKLLKQIEELEKEKLESSEKITKFEREIEQSGHKLTELETKIKSILGKIFTESEVRTIFQ